MKTHSWIIEASKSGAASCGKSRNSPVGGCQGKIQKGELRIKKTSVCRDQGWRVHRVTRWHQPPTGGSAAADPLHRSRCLDTHTQPAGSTTAPDCTRIQAARELPAAEGRHAGPAGLQPSGLDPGRERPARDDRTVAWSELSTWQPSSGCQSVAEH